MNHALGVRRSHLLALLVLALAVRIAFLVVVAHPELRQGRFAPTASSDEEDYHAIAANLADHGVYRLHADGPPTAKRPPGMILPLAALYALGGPRPLLAVAYVTACSLLLVPLCGALARESGGGPGAALWAMGIAAFAPTLIFTAAGIWSEPPALLFTLLSLYLLVRDAARGLHGRLWPYAGLALGAAYLIRPAAGALLALVGALLLASALRTATATDRRRRLVRLFACGVLAALPILAWGVRNQLRFGEPFFGNTESAVALWGANNPVTAGLRPPALRTWGGVDLVAEAAAGRYRGSWIPPSYVSSEPPPASELARHHLYTERTRGFVRDHPAAFVRLLGYKVLRVLTAEPLAPSILREGSGQRRLKRLVTFGERWFFLGCGGAGLLFMLRRRHPHAAYYLCYAAAGMAVVLVAYANARIFLPVAGTLIVPAALLLDHLRAARWRSP